MATPARALTRGHRDTSPEVSPDGRWVAFLRAEPEGKPQVHVVEATGGEPIRLTDAPLGASEPRFSPDGTRIAYVARVPEEGRYAADGKPGNEDPRHITELKYRSDGVGFFRDRPQHVFVVDVPVDGERPATLPEPVALTAGDIGVSGARVAAVGRRTGRRLGAARGRGSRTCAATRCASTPRRAARPAPPVPLTDADAGSTLGVDAVLPSADGSTLWLLAGDLGPTGRDFVADPGRASTGWRSTAPARCP